MFIISATLSPYITLTTNVPSDVRDSINQTPLHKNCGWWSVNLDLVQYLVETDQCDISEYHNYSIGSNTCVISTSGMLYRNQTCLRWYVIPYISVDTCTHPFLLTQMFVYSIVVERYTVIRSKVTVVFTY